MTAHRTPRTTEQATMMAERYAVLSGKLAGVEAERNRVIADINAKSDVEAAPILAELGLIHEKLAPWWEKSGVTLTKGKRKSIELGGCMIGSRSGKESLGTADDVAPVIAWLQKRDWAAALLRTTVTIDKAAVLKSIDGVYKKQLAQLGFRRVPGSEAFFIAPAEQQGTQAGVAA